MIKTFLKNIRYLTKNKISDKLKVSSQIHDLLDNIKYELNDSTAKKPKIKTIDETIDFLINTKKSISRFGDGELELIKGNDIPFQRASLDLSKKLKEILSSRDERIAVAIPRMLYSDLSLTITLVKNFWRLNGNKFRLIAEEYIDFNYQYYAAESTLAYTIYTKYDFQAYFKKIRQIWDNCDLTIICNDKVFDNIGHNIFDCAKSLEYLYAPAKNAFEEYEKILMQAKKIDTNRTVAIILGPTATVLAYDLALLGYRAIDCGHIVKSYEYYMSKRQVQNMVDAIEFFKD